MPPIHPLSSTPMAGALIMHPHRYSLLCVLSCTHMPTQAYVNVYVCAIYACVCVHAGSACCVTLHEAAQGARRRVTGAYEYLAASSSADMPSGVLAFASAFFCRAGGARQVCVSVCVCVCAHMNAANPTDFALNTHGTPKKGRLLAPKTRELTHKAPSRTQTRIVNVRQKFARSYEAWPGCASYRSIARNRNPRAGSLSAEIDTTALSNAAYFRSVERT